MLLIILYDGQNSFHAVYMFLYKNTHIQKPDKMFSLDDFKNAIGYEHSTLLPEECKTLYDIVVLSKDWDTVYSAVNGSKFPNKSLKMKIDAFAKKLETNKDERVNFMKCHLDNIKVKDMDFAQCKKAMCCESGGLSDFISDLETYCPQSTTKLRSNDVISMYISLTSGGLELFKENAKLRYQDKKAFAEQYSTKKMHYDVQSVQSIISNSVRGTLGA
jgi:hypothetical protein